MSRYERRMRKPNKLYNNPITEECWNLDISLCRFLGTRLLMYYNTAQKIIERDDWFVIKQNALRLINWSNHFDIDTEFYSEKQMYEEAQTALHWVAENLGTLWW